MLTLTAIRTDLTTTFTTARGRRLYRTWTDQHPILTAYPTPLDAVRAAQHHTLDGDEILNAFLALSATEPLAQQAIVVAFQPWVAARIGFCHEGIASLADRARSGRPRRFGSGVVAGIKALACEPRKQSQVPLSRWSSAELAGQAVSGGLVPAISSSTVRRWLHAEVIKPWRHRSWTFPRDTDFAAKAGPVLDLYAGVWEGCRSALTTS